jgi:poly(hydroxyalkanoate) depolymerase family esterase
MHLYKTKSSKRIGLGRIIALIFVIVFLPYGCRRWRVGPSQKFPLTEVNNFGTNPGDLQMFKFIPSPGRSPSALVVAIHGCAQNAQDFADHSGWPELANRMGFLLVFPQQSITNNPARCFNWFQPKNSKRDSGEALSIDQMVERMKADYKVDLRRIYVTGLSAGGAMTSIMLATYPEVFAGGAIMAGVPYSCATTLSQTFTCMQSSVPKTPKEWGDLVRGASRATAWPIVSIWQGTADKVIAPVNSREELEQWTDVHGISQAPSRTDKVSGYPHQVFSAPNGKAVVEVYSITDMGHGQAVDPGMAPRQCGTAEAFFPNAHICAAYYASKFWGLIH